MPALTIPAEYLRASRDFERFLADLKAISLLATHNQCYAMTRAVLRTFRSHLETPQALRFADALPPVLRAIFVEAWDPAVPATPFPDRRALHAEVLAERRDHNTASDTAIADVAAALRRNVDAAAFDAVLATLPPAAGDFWRA